MHFGFFIKRTGLTLVTLQVKSYEQGIVISHVSASSPDETRAKNLFKIVHCSTGRPSL
jgi:hypothetical protein